MSHLSTSTQSERERKTNLVKFAKNGRGQLQLDFYGHFYCLKPLSNGHCKKDACVFVHVLIDLSFKFADKELSQKCDIYYSVLFLQNFCSCLIL